MADFWDLVEERERRDPPSEREFLSFFLCDWPALTEAQAEASRRLARRTRDLVLRDLYHQIRREPPESRHAEFLHEVRLAVLDA